MAFAPRIICHALKAQRFGRGEFQTRPYGNDSNHTHLKELNYNRRVNNGAFVVYAPLMLYPNRTCFVYSRPWQQAEAFA